MFNIDPFSVLIGYIIGLILCRSVSSIVFPGVSNEKPISSYNSYSQGDE
jgi:hypothetical protein